MLSLELCLAVLETEEERAEMREKEEFILGRMGISRADGIGFDDTERSLFHVLFLEIKR